MNSTVTIIGNLTDVPELRYTANGLAFAKFSVAVNERKKVGDEWQDEAHFFRCTTWREQAENIAQLDKGTRVIVYGKLRQNRWEKNGEKQSAVEINADEVGPSLRWATASVTRAEKTNNGPTNQPADTDPF